MHIHVPAGAVPKDGPSAGVAIAAALISLFRDQPIQPEPGHDRRGDADRPGPARGRRPRERSSPLAAPGSRRVLIPRHNEKDLVELPAEVKADLTFHSVDTLDDVVPSPLPQGARTSASPPQTRKKPVPTATARTEVSS